MEISRHLAQFPFFLFKLLQRPLKQRQIVCFHLKLPAHRQGVRIAAQEGRRRQAELRVPAFGPRIAEVQVDAVHFARAEDLTQVCGVKIQKSDVFQPRRFGTLHGKDHGVRHLLDGDNIAPWLALSQRAGKAALSAADFQQQRPAGLSPAAAHCFRLGNQVFRTPFHARLQIVPFAHSHSFLYLSNSFACISED